MKPTRSIGMPPESGRRGQTHEACCGLIGVSMVDVKVPLRRVVIVWIVTYRRGTAMLSTEDLFLQAGEDVKPSPMTCSCPGGW
jgi:hypothetical protein